MNMELDYSGAKNLEEARAIHKAFWDNIHQEHADGKWRELTREEFFRWGAEIAASSRKEKEERKAKEKKEREQNERENNGRYDQNSSYPGKPVSD
jgi:hypothetical protein